MLRRVTSEAKCLELLAEQKLVASQVAAVDTRSVRARPLILAVTTGLGPGQTTLN